mgnify:FL=1
MSITDGTLKICGDEITVVRNLSGEIGSYALLAGSVQLTKPFQIETFNEVKFQTDSGIVAGDLVKRNRDSQYYLCTSINKEAIFNISEYLQGVLYKCNISGEVQRFRLTRTYNTEAPSMNWYRPSSGIVWGIINTFNLLEHDSEIGDINTANVNLWLQNSIDIQPKDRFVSSGEKWVVETVDTHSFPGIKFLKINIDTR